MVWERLRLPISSAGTIAGMLIAIRGITWHSATVDSPATVVAGVSMAATWFLIAALPRLPLSAAVMSGAAAIALVLAAGGRWTVPFLLFWLSSNSALHLGSHRRWFTWATSAVLLADLPLFAGLLLIAVRDDLWRLPVEPDPAIVWAVCFSAVGRIVSVSVARDRGPEAPLIVGSGFVLLALLGPGAAPVPAAVLIAAAALIAFRPITADPVLFVSLLAAGSALNYGPALSMAAIAALLAITATGSSSQPDRAGVVLLAGPWPGTALFVAVTGAAVYSAERVAETSLLGGGAFLAVSILLPIALAGSVHLATPLIRSRVRTGRLGERSEEMMPWGRAEVCALVGIVAGLSAAGFSAPDTSGYLYLSALVAGGLFVIGVPGAMLPSLARPPVTTLMSSVSFGGSSGPAALKVAGSVALAAAWLGVVWVTYEGLRDGFL